jgi:iron complex outermembrane receptor protein
MLVVSHSRLLFSCSNPTFFSFSPAKESDAKQTENSVWLIVAFVLAALMTFGLSSTPVQAQTDNPQSSTSQGNEAAGQTLEVVVTAQKREERLQDVPIPVSVVSAAALRDNNQVRIQDYYAEVPGLAIAQSTMGTNTVSIRGITTGAVGSGPPAPSPTVGVVVDDVPFGGVGGGDQFIPDFDPGDLQRIEVLRGSSRSPLGPRGIRP